MESYGDVSCRLVCPSFVTETWYSLQPWPLFPPVGDQRSHLIAFRKTDWKEPLSRVFFE